MDASFDMVIVAGIAQARGALGLVVDKDWAEQPAPIMPGAHITHVFRPISCDVNEAELLEQTLRTMRPNTRVINGRVAGAVALLEDRLELVDVRLQEARVRRLPRERVIVLWQERIDLMDALVNVQIRPRILIGF